MPDSITLSVKHITADELSRLIAAISRLIEESRPANGDEVLYDLHAIAQKCIGHATSMATLLCAMKREPKDMASRKNVYTCSALVLLRSVYEGFRVFSCHAYRERPDWQFRYNCWKYASIVNSGKIAHKDQTIQDSAKKLLNELRIVIEPNLNDMASNVDKLKQGDLDKGRWHKGFEDLPHEEPFIDSRFSDLYTICCQHSHSSYIGVLQNAAFASMPDHDWTHGIFNASNEILYIFLKSYKRAFKLP